MRYFNQIRALRCGKVLENADWEDACSGHSTYEKALCCALAQEKMLQGGQVDVKLASEITQRMVQVHGAIYEALGVKFEMRIVKRMDEVIDDA